MATPADSLAGHVVVIAADDGRVADAVAALLDAGALVGVVTNNADQVRRLEGRVFARDRQPLMFRANPADAPILIISLSSETIPLSQIFDVNLTKLGAAQQFTGPLPGLLT